MAKLDIDHTSRDCEIGQWKEITSYLGRYYGQNGDELGEIPISIAPITYFEKCELCKGTGEIMIVEDLENDYEDDCTACGGNGKCESSAWVVAETPEENTTIHEFYDYEEEAQNAAEEMAEELDETPDLDEIIQKIEDTNYFDDPDIIPFVIKSLTEHTQGHLLITPDIHQPVNVRWTTNGYLDCDHISISTVDFKNKFEAAEALLKAVKNKDEDENDY